MILHIVVDDKFTDVAYRIFEEVYPGLHEYLIVSKSRKYKYIKRTPVKAISTVKFLGNSFIKRLSNYDMVVLHCLDDLKMLMMSKAANDIKFVWIGWGFDYYDVIYGERPKLFLPLTASLFSQENHPGRLSLITKIKSMIKDMYYGKIQKTEMINRINYFSPVLYEDYALVRKSIPDLKPKFLSWNYGSLEDDLIFGYENASVSGNNILIGNSATYENNHLDAFELLAKLVLSDKKIIVPLSYGNTRYRDIVSKRGKKLWGDSCIPIADFMPIQDYVNLVKSCSVVIMNHIRQQALGNIAIMMHLGATVFLRKQNPIYGFFKEEGAHIYAFDDLINNHELINIRLSNSEVEANRTILRKHWSRDAIHVKTRNLIKRVMADAKRDDHLNYVATTNDATCH